MIEEVVEMASHRDPDPSSTDGFVVGPVELSVKGEEGPLVGRRFVVKDLYDVAGTRTGAGNPARLAETPLARANASSVQALIDAGAQLVGKTVTDEFAFSLSGTNVHYGTPLNPAAPDRVPGGSSSGSASVVAGGAVDFALGTDTGGSTRVPASYCGIYGLRATHGRISSEGVFLLAPSFCSIGLFARSGSMLERCWRTLATSAAAQGGPRHARRATEIVIAPELFGLADPLAGDVLEAAAHRLAKEWELPVHVRSFGAVGDVAEVLACFRTIQMYEAWELHGAFVRAHHDSFGGGIVARFDAASGVTPFALEEARLRRIDLQRRFRSYLGDGAYLVQPAASGPAPASTLDGEAKDDLRLRTMQLTSPAGLVGAPVVSLPVAHLGHYPLGLALVGLPDDDDEIVGLASRTHRIELEVDPPDARA